MGTELFFQKLTLPYQVYYSVVLCFTHYGRHQRAPVMEKTVNPQRPILGSGMLCDPKSDTVQITRFIPYLQTECSQEGLPISQIQREKLADTPRVFLFIVLWQTKALKVVFENHSLFIFINKHGIM